MSTPRHFCTYFDSRYAARGFAMIDSLRRASPGMRVFVLCLDAKCLALCHGLAAPDVSPIALAELEAAAPDLAAVKPTRSTLEYYFTCTAAFICHLLQRHPEIPLLTYVDADLFFFANVEPLFDELGDDAVGIIEHRYSARMQAAIVNGRFNVGWLSFRRDERALACLNWWRERCLEWCYDRVEADRFADQKYLDAWPTRFAGVRILRHPGANAAPWNVGDAPVHVRDGLLRVGNAPLLFYHFHGLRRLCPWLYDTRLRFCGVRPDRVLRRCLYHPYLQAVRTWESIAVGTPLARTDHQPHPHLDRPGWAGTRRFLDVLRLVKAAVQGQWVCVFRPVRSAPNPRRPSS